AREPAGTEYAPVPLRNFVESFGAFGAKPCADVLTFPVVTSERDSFASVTAPLAIVKAPVLAIVASPDIATSAATLELLPTRMCEFVSDEVDVPPVLSDRFLSSTD